MRAFRACLIISISDRELCHIIIKCIIITIIHKDKLKFRLNTKDGLYRIEWVYKVNCNSLLNAFPLKKDAAIIFCTCSFIIVTISRQLTNELHFISLGNTMYFRQKFDWNTWPGSCILLHCTNVDWTKKQKATNLIVCIVFTSVS